MRIQTHPAYRPDIDGLRAIAVLSVVFFHAFPSVLTGGFVGVDVFFVISGFLITGILYRESQLGQVSLKSFYAKRVRRIFPALLLVLVFSLVIGWIALTSDEYTQLTRHGAAGAAFLSNVVFWRESGYFDNPAETKPLLHLWSLAIEEQFYLFWPLILIYIFKPVKKILIPISVLIAASLGYSIWKIGIDAVGDFYSLLTRFWELLVGGFLACALVQAPDFANQYKKYISLLGLVLLVAGAVLINRQSAFPGAWALLPVLGAAALILSQGSFVNQKILSHPVLVGVGLISYPLYLWHWPLLSFARIFKGGTPDVAVRVELVVASFLLAWLTYQYVEKPIRTGGPSKTKVMALSLLMVVVFSVSFYIKTNHGFSFRQFGKLNGDASTMVIGADRGTHKHFCGIEHVPDINMEWCIQDNKLPHPNYAVLGDSKGEALYYGLSRESGPDQSWMMIGPVNFLSGYSNGLAKLAMDRIVGDSQIKTVVLGNALRGFTNLNQTTGFVDSEIDGGKIDAWVNSYTSVITFLEASGKRIVFVVDNPTLPDPNSCISGAMTDIPLLNKFIFRNANKYCQIRYSDHLVGTAPYQVFLKLLKERNRNLVIFDPAAELCNLRDDLCSILDGDSFLYSYGDHISDFASSKIAKKLLPLIVN